MSRLLTLAMILLAAVAAAADVPTLINQDDDQYSFTLHCPQLDAYQQLAPLKTVQLDGYKPGCELWFNELSNEHYAQKVKLKKSSECVVKNKTLRCQ